MSNLCLVLGKIRHCWQIQWTMLLFTSTQTCVTATVCLQAGLPSFNPHPLYLTPLSALSFHVAWLSCLRCRTVPQTAIPPGSPGHRDGRGRVGATQVGNYTLINNQGSHYAFRDRRAEAPSTNTNNNWCYSSHTAGPAGIMDGQEEWFY